MSYLMIGVHVVAALGAAVSLWGSRVGVISKIWITTFAGVGFYHVILPWWPA